MVVANVLAKAGSLMCDLWALGEYYELGPYHTEQADTKAGSFTRTPDPLASTETAALTYLDECTA
jgi:hypothetical protein